MRRFDEKVAIVTGGARGIGAAICRRLAGEGAKVAITDVLTEEGAALASEVSRNGGEAEFWRLDVTEESDAKDVAAAVHEKWGRIDILVNNAGILGVNKPTHEVAAEEWRRVMDVNVCGVFFMTKHVAPYIQQGRRGGAIVNISSIYGIIGAPDLPPYHASKGAVREMSKTDAMIYAPDRIRVNSIHPGAVETDMLKDLAASSGSSYERTLDLLIELHPIGFAGAPEDIAAGVAYLASDDGRFVTGTELIIDGGYTCR